MAFDMWVFFSFSASSCATLPITAVAAEVDDMLGRLDGDGVEAVELGEALSRLRFGGVVTSPAAALAAFCAFCISKRPVRVTAYIHGAFPINPPFRPLL